jgi:hypothetical protein
LQVAVAELQLVAVAVVVATVPRLLENFQEVRLLQNLVYPLLQAQTTPLPWGLVVLETLLMVKQLLLVIALFFTQ